VSNQLGQSESNIFRDLVAKESQLDANQLDHDWEQTWELSLASDPISGVKFVRNVVQYLESMPWPENDVFGIHMAVEEAIMNAIKHGNRQEADKVVHIVCRVSKSRFYLLVKDEGEGFDPDDLPDPTLEENLTKPSGRGVLLMRAYMDHVEFNAAGNQVELLKHASHGS